jgi:transcription elongation factor
MASNSDSYDDSESSEYESDEGNAAESGKRKRGKSSKKKRPVKKSRFSLIDDAAEESEDDEEDLQRQRERALREDENDSQEVQDLRAQMNARLDGRMKAKKILENVSMEDMAQDVKDRARAQKKEQKRLRKQMGNRSQKERHMPTPNDPRLFAVKCKTGSERLLTLQVLNKYRAIVKKNKKNPRKTPRVFSATSNKTKGYIYVEAYSKDDVVNFVRGIQGLYPSQCDMTPLNEMTSIFNIVRKTNTLKVGQWVRMKNGVYRGDLGRIETRPNARGQVVVRLIPRVDYAENHIPKHIYMKEYLKGELTNKLRQVKEVNEDMAEKINECLDNLEDQHQRVTAGWAKKQVYYDDDAQTKTLEAFWKKGENKYNAERLREKNQGVRPEQKFFDLKEVENAFGQLHHEDKMAQMEQMQNKKITFVKFRKGYYRQGFLFKNRINVGAVDQEIKPSLEELQQFRSHLSGEGGSDDEGADDGNDAIHMKIASDLKHAKGGMEKSIPFEIGDTARVTSSDLKNAYVKILKIEPTERKALVKVLSDAAEFWIELDNLEKHFRVGMRVKVIHGVHVGEVGYIQHIKTDGGLVEATVTDVRYTKEIKVFVKDIVESNEKAVQRSSLAGYDLYDLVQIGVGGKRGVIVRCGRESFLVIGTDGGVSTVTPSELSRKMNNISKRGQVIDKQGQYLSSGDFALITEGKSKGKMGKIMHISNAFVFLHSRGVLENAGILVAKSNILQLAGYKSQQDLTELSMGMITRDSTVGGQAHISQKRSGAMNLNKRPEREKKDLLIGKTVQITQGNWKGMIGIVVDGTATHRTIELHSKNKTVTVMASRCLEVTNDRSGKIIERNYESDRGGMTPGTGYSGYSGTLTPGMTPGMYTPGMFGAGGITPGLPGAGLGGATPMLGGITPMTMNNDGDWNTPVMQTPAMNTPAPSSVYSDDMVSTDMGGSSHAGGQGYGMAPQQQQAWGNDQQAWGNAYANPSAPQSWAGNSSMGSSAYNQGPPSYSQSATGYGAPSTTSMPTPSELGGSSVGYNQTQMYNAGNVQQTPVSTGGATPSGLQTPMSLAGGDDGGDSSGIWDPVRRPESYKGVMVILGDGKSGVIQNSLVNKPHYHNVLPDGGQIALVHEKDVSLVRPEKGDAVVILKTTADDDENKKAQRGKVQSVEGSDYVVEDPSGEIDFYEMEQIGKLKL